MSKQTCAEIAEKYNNFRKIEKSWRADFNLARNDRDARRRAHAGMKEVREAFERLPRFCGYEKAQEILGKDFLGAEAVQTTFGFKVDPSEIPLILFSPKELRDALAHDEQLILRVSHDGEGNPMTMERMLQIMDGRMPEGKKLLFAQKRSGSDEMQDDCWFNDEVFFRQNSLKMEWVLVGKELVPETIEKNYVEQTIEIYKYLQDRKLLTDAEKTEYAGLEETLKRLCFEMGMDWQTKEIKEEEQVKYDENWAEVAKKLADLPINQKYRRNAVEILFDWLMNFNTGNSRGKLEDFFDWSNTVYSDGDLASLGNFDSNGGNVGGWDPAGRHADWGSVLLRRPSRR